MKKTMKTSTLLLLLCLSTACDMDSPAETPGTPDEPANSGYTVVDTGQVKCYSNSAETTPPSAGQAFYGQDAQTLGTQPDYSLSDDGKTVLDKNTGLVWMRAPNTTLTMPVTADKVPYSQLTARLQQINDQNHGGYSDWRIPTIKELYSLMNFTGTDPSGMSGSDTSGLTPFIDTRFFLFGYGEPSQGERIIDSQYASRDLYVVNPGYNGTSKLFGLNLADGRIKGYDLTMPGGLEKTFFLQCVRGQTLYGQNAFHDNRDETITDAATGLVWTKGDSGSAMTWQQALAWAEARNADRYLGHSDWRLPNAKELHSLVHLANAPDFNGLPAIDTAYFSATPITNENGDSDYACYWTSTTHAAYNGMGASAVYIAFGRALGWPDWAEGWQDVHGAGAQRSDPKASPPYGFADLHRVVKNGITHTGYAHGPQGDALRGLNFVRLVRNVR